MKQFVLISLAFLPFFALFAQTGQQGDWEFVPLTGGHVSFFVPNPFNENDLFAVAETPHVFYSSDRGRNWRNISGNLKDVLGVNPRDLAVTQNGWIYLTGCQYSCLIRSTDWGETWERLEVAGADTLSTHSTIFSTEDGRLWVFNQNYGLLKYSDDYGNSWSVLTLPITSDWRFGNVANAINMVHLYGFGSRGFYDFTTDRGRTWSSDTSFTKHDYISNMFAYTYQSEIVLGIWARYFTRSQNPKWFDYFESEDSGRTWEQKNSDPISTGGYPAMNQNNSRPFTVAYENGTILTSRNHHLCRSTDRGVTWEIEYNKPDIFDLYLYNDTLFTSMPMVGIVRSTDTGRTWFPVESLGEMALFAWTELQVVDGYACALVNDGYTSYKVSTDNGDTWEEIFRPSAYNIVITTWPEPRYTMMGGGKVISGTIKQAVPDTVLHEIGPIVYPLHGGDQAVNLVSSPAHPGLLYLVAGSDSLPWLYHSLDGGQTWEREPAPPYAYMEFGPKPSRLHTDRLAVIATPRDDNWPQGSGIWYVENYGKKWTLTNDQMEARPIAYVMTQNDNLFQSLGVQFSTNYGTSWQTFNDGIQSIHTDLSYIPFMAGNILFSTYYYVWYYFNGTKWEEFTHYKEGEPVWQNRPRSMWYIDDILWVDFPQQGIYKIERPAITSSPDIPEPRDFALSAYPNPFADACHIRFFTEGSGSELAITDIMGRLVIKTMITRGQTDFTWDGFDMYGREAPEGMYFVRLSGFNKTVRKIVKISY